MRCSRTLYVLTLLALFLPATEWLFAQTNFFDYSRYLFGTPSTLSLDVQSVNATTGVVTVGGVDTQGPATPFTWYWGDGQVSSGFFPQSHTYSNATKNYLLDVISHYSGGKTDSCMIAVRFVPPSIVPIALSPDIAVTIPNYKVNLISRLAGFGFSSTLSYFGDSFFTAIPRATLEYILSVTATIEKDLVNGDVLLINNGFQQVMLRDTSFGGAYSIWYSSPVALGVGDYFMQGSISYFALFHEMGHNMTLNSPAKYIYGGKVDGNANAIFSESMAYIFQQAVGYQIVNNYLSYGLSDDLMSDMKSSVISSIGSIRYFYEQYVANGKKFTSWNDPSTTVDETVGTFQTIAYKFCEQAEQTGQEYRTPLKRMLKLLQGFNPSWSQRYDQSHNTAAADTFRATLMVTAMSYGFGKDLRSDFRNLNFPISDQIYNELYSAAAATAGAATTIALASGNGQTAVAGAALSNPFVVTVTDSGGNPVSGVSVNFAIASTPTGATGQSLSTSTITTNFMGQASSVLTLGNKAGTYAVTATSSGLSGSPVTFTASATAGTPTTIALTSGNAQTALISSVLSNPFLVTVADVGGNPVSGVSVTFAIASSPTAATEQSLSTRIATTNTNGQVSTLLTLGNKAGAYTVTAASSGLSGSPVTFSATATNPVPTLYSLSTKQAGRGSRTNVTLTGTNFLDGVTTASFGADITVNSQIVSSGTQIGVNISISSTATLGTRDVTVTNAGPGGGTVTLSNGFTIDASVATSAEGALGAIPGEFVLYDAYPNPFNPSTTISFAVPRSASVSLRIFNPLGQEIALLVNEERSPGYYSMRWDASTVPSGIYFYRLQARQISGGQAGEFVETKKMILLK